MKIKFVTILMMSASLLSCQKDKDDAPQTNWNEELKDTYWIGEYENYSQKYQGLQPFSIVLGADGKVSWSDMVNTRSAGNWTVIKDTLKIVFPNNIGFSSVISKTKLSGFKAISWNDFKIMKLDRSAKVPAGILGNYYEGTVRGKPFRLEITGGNSLRYSFDQATVRTEPYKVEGAGIRFSVTWSFNEADYYYAVVDSATSELRGIETHVTMSATSYNAWTVKKK